MKKTASVICLLLCISGVARVKAQHHSLQKEPCFTKHWVDSANAATLEKLKAAIPNMAEWYAYEGQEQPAPTPVNLVNIIFVKLEKECPE